MSQILVIWPSTSIFISITSPSNIPHLTDLDADLNMPLDNNFCFYSTHDFHSNYDIKDCQSFVINLFL